MAAGFDLSTYRDMTYGEKCELYDRLVEENSYRGPSGDEFDYEGELFELQNNFEDFIREVHLTDKPLPQNPVFEAPTEPEFVRISREEFERSMRAERNQLMSQIWPACEVTETLGEGQGEKKPETTGSSDGKTQNSGRDTGAKEKPATRGRGRKGNKKN
jgi:hypothetical protein